MTVGGGSRGGVRVTGGGQKFEPSKSRPILYGDLPELEEDIPLALVGPQTVLEFVDVLAQATGWNFMATTAVQDIPLQFWMNEMTPEQAMAVLKFNGVYYEFDEETQFIYVMTTDEYLKREYGTVVEQAFTIRHADVEDIEDILSTFLSPEGRMVIVPTTSQIYVFDTKDNLARMKEVVEEVDIPLDARVFRLEHIDVESVLDSVELLLTERGEMYVDPRTNTMVVTDLPARQDEVAAMLEQLDLPLETRTWILNYVDPSMIADQAALLVPEGMGLIATNEDIHQITVSAIPNRLEQIDALIRAWDIKRKQVQIEAFLITASTNIGRNLGIDWSYYGESDEGLFAFQTGDSGPRFATPPSAGQQLSIGQLPFAIPMVNPVTGAPLSDIMGSPLLRGFGGNDLSIMLNYLETSGDVTILAHPRVTVQDGEEAIFENTTSVPYAQSTADRPSTRLDASGSPVIDYRSISRIDFIDVGTILTVLPRIAQEGNILMDITAEDSNFLSVTVIGADQEYSVPEKTQNRTATQVMVRDRQTIVIGGLRTSNFTNDVDKVPFLSDLPLLGRLFRSTKKQHRHTELLIFITPTIVDENTQPEATRLAKLDEGMAQAMRYDRKSFMGRLADSVSRGQNELLVSIGQSGDLFASGALVTLGELREMFFDEDFSAMMVVIRRHPRAPSGVIMAVTEIAMEAELKIEFDDALVPFVPAQPQKGGHEEAGTDP